MTRALLILAVLLPLPSLAMAQDARRFDAKELEKQFDPIPVFSVGGRAVDDEVVVQSDASTRECAADYLVAAGAKAILDFYQVKLATKPRKEGAPELGTFRFVFAPPVDKGDKWAVQVVVRPVEGNAGLVAIRLLKRPAADR